MEQSGLRELENRCIQEQPPQCTAACPIHVDVRAFSARMKLGQWAEAWKVLQKTMPLPGVLARICDAPCRENCKRGEAGAPVNIGRLERACARLAPQGQRILPLPAKGKRVAVVGSGLSSLTVAWDLARKGYGVTVFESGEKPGGNLLNIPDSLLPRNVLESETAVLTSLGVVFRTGENTANPAFPVDILGEFAALYLGLDSPGEVAWDLEPDDDGRPKVQPLAQTTSLAGVFAGGRDSRTKPFSPVWQAAEGRWAATSIDRYIQKVSPTAGREKDGPYRSRLHTSLEGVTPLPETVMSDPGSGYSDIEAREEAGRCLQCQCLECVKVCTYLESFGSYPKRYAREIYNNESIVMGTRKANKLINSCSLCGLCEEVCPEDFAMQDLCLETRRSMVRQGKMPPSAHEFALQDMDYSNGDRFFLNRNQPSTDSSAYLFFPGCQLSASSPGHVRQAYSYLTSACAGGVGLLLMCCGAPALWAGREEAFQAVLERLREQWKLLGDPTIITACSTCLKVFREHLSEVQVVSLWEIMREKGGRFPQVAGNLPKRLALHDPCTTRHEKTVQQSVRALLSDLGVEVEELPLSGARTECCGFGGLMQNANPELAREVIIRRAGLSATPYAAYCAMCRDSLAAVGKPALHVLDLLFPAGEENPAVRKRPGWSERRENRARLKNSLLVEVWGERGLAMDEGNKIKLIIPEDVREVLDNRRILIEDIQQVVARAEKTGTRLLHPQTGHFKASFKPMNVTFWVEYSLDGSEYIIHNAYSHRMEVVGGQGNEA